MYRPRTLTNRTFWREKYAGKGRLGYLLMYLSTQQPRTTLEGYTKVPKKIPRRGLISTWSETISQSIELRCVSKRKTGQWDCERDPSGHVRRDLFQICMYKCIDRATDYAIAIKWSCNRKRGIINEPNRVDASIPSVVDYRGARSRDRPRGPRE